MFFTSVVIICSYDDGETAGIVGSAATAVFIAYICIPVQRRTRVPSRRRTSCVSFTRARGERRETDCTRTMCCG